MAPRFAVCHGAKTPVSRVLGDLRNADWCRVRDRSCTDQAFRATLTASLPVGWRSCQEVCNEIRGQCPQGAGSPRRTTLARSTSSFGASRRRNVFSATCSVFQITAVACRHRGALGGRGAQPHRRERRLDRIRCPPMLPVLAALVGVMNDVRRATLSDRSCWARRRRVPCGDAVRWRSRSCAGSTRRARPRDTGSPAAKGLGLSIEQIRRGPTRVVAHRRDCFRLTPCRLGPPHQPGGALTAEVSVCQRSLESAEI